MASPAVIAPEQPETLQPLTVRARAQPSAPLSGSAPRLSVVIVNYHQWRETHQLVEQLQQSTSSANGQSEILIVDNHSPPHPLRGRLRRRPGVSLRRWGRNHGYACGVNEGCRLSRGEWLLLLNPDISVPPAFLDRVHEIADQLQVSDPRVGVVGFQLRHGDGSPQLSTGGFPTLFGTLSGLLWPRAQRKYTRRAPHQRRLVPWVTGCCQLVRRGCLEQLGGFDEDFFLYYEDVDFCRRAAAAGWSVLYEPALEVVHYRPLHLRQVPSHLRVCTRHALLTYGSKHWPRWQFLTLAGIVRLEAWFRRRWAGCRGNAESENHFQKLAELVHDLTLGQPRDARVRLDSCVLDWERRQGG